MAYNVLKGTVEGSVDQHADQEIGGVKVFKNTISASVFYDTDAQSPCATENNVAIKKLNSTTKGGIVTYEVNKLAKSHYNLTFDGKTLTTDNAVFKNITADASGLNNIPANNLVGHLNVDTIVCDNDLETHNGLLRVRKSNGITTTEEGLSVDLSPNGALSFKNGKIIVEPQNTLDVTTGGQNISDSDIVLLHDGSRGELRHTTFKNLYDGYISVKIPKASGTINAVQLKGNRGFASSDNLSYDVGSNTLNINGNTRTLDAEINRNFKSNGATEINGALYKTIKTVSETEYQIQDTDNTVLLNVSKNNILAVLPPAKENYGRVINVKVVVDEDQKYNIRGARAAKIKTNGELIDFTKEIMLKSNYSSRTFHSDGVKWWVINANGS